MKNLFLALGFISLPFLTQAQCNCKEEFSKIKNHLESNYTGFKDKAPSNNFQNNHFLPRAKAAFRTLKSGYINKYEDFTAQKEQLAARAKNKAQCYFIINQWMSYFNDDHVYSGLNEEAIGKIDPKKLQSDFPIEKFAVSDELIKKLENAKGIEGIYTKKSESFSMAVIKNKKMLLEITLL